MNTKTQHRQFVVIGGVAAGMSAASAIKREAPSASVLVIEKGEFISYSACSLPYYIADLVKEPQQLIVFSPEHIKQERDIDVWTRHEVMAIYPAKNMLAVLDRDTGTEKNLHYDALMLATGGIPISPPLPGIDLPNIFHVRTLTDGIQIKQFIAEHTPQNVTILGGSYIGLEMAEACRMLGMEVSILEKKDNLMRTMGAEITNCIEQELHEQGIQLVKNVRVDGFEVLDERCGYVLADNEKLRVETDMVIITIGIRPDVVLAKGAGIELGKTQAITVNRNLQTSLEHIYAGGDCTEVTHLVSGERVYFPAGSTASKQGRIAGRNMVNPGSAQFKGIVGTAVVKFFDLEIARTGLSLLEAKRLGFNAVTSTITAESRAPTYPGSQPMTVSLIIDTTTKRLLGAEMAGKDGVAKRIDVLATALYNQMTIQAIAQLDLSYAPPFAPVWDPILVAANAALKKL